MINTSLLRKEDYLAIWIGFIFILTGLAFFLTSGYQNYKNAHSRYETILSFEESNAPFKTITWYQAQQNQESLKPENSSIGIYLAKLTENLERWSENPVRAIFLSRKRAAAIAQQYAEPLEAAKNKEAAAYANAIKAEDAARQTEYENKVLNQAAKDKILAWREYHQELNAIKSKYNTKPYNRLPWLLVWGLILAGIFGAGAKLMGDSFLVFLKGFAFIFLLAFIAYFLASNQAMKNFGIGYAAWAIVLGILISNTLGTPGWAKSSLKTEFFIKTGLVLLGAEILIGKIMAIGLPGLLVAWIVTPIVLVTTYWFGQKVVKVSSKTLNITISADMSVCGVSAAIATAAACNAKKEELTLAVGLSMIFTSVMMILLPIFIKWIGIPEVLGGAWIGGTIDATGAVVAAGAFLGDTAMAVAATIKMIQNILIGVIAFAVAIYFTYKVENKTEKKIGAGEIWKRLPKFILGFIAASVLFSLIYATIGSNMGYSMIDNGVIGGFTSNIRGWLFCLAFVSIGLSTNFKELRHHFKGGKPLILYLTGQTLNLILTLLMAYIMFYLVFPNITETL
jgi:uncharacterized integral membrane protein (TIGR00698 family)